MDKIELIKEKDFNIQLCNIYYEYLLASYSYPSEYYKNIRYIIKNYLYPSCNNIKTISYSLQPLYTYKRTNTRSYKYVLAENIIT